jgi:uncharacterized repeat protein (TIGR01451 family)
MADPSTPADVRLTPSEVAEIQASLPARPGVEVDPATHRSVVMSVVPSIPADGTARVRVATVPRQLVTGPVIASVPVNRQTMPSGYVSNVSRAATVYAAKGVVPQGLSAADCQGIEEACAYADAYQKNLEDVRGFASNHACGSFSGVTVGFTGGNCSFDPRGGVKGILGKKFPGFGFLNGIYGSFKLIKDLFDLSDRIEGRMDGVNFGVTAIDPNDKLSPAGSGAGHYISGDEPIPYTIRFENLRTATAAAQQVQITDPLPSQLDPATVQVVAAEIGGTPINVGAGSTAAGVREVDGSAVLDAPSGRSVRLHTETDLATAKLTVSLQGPATLDDPFSPSPFSDFLPPDDDTGRGQGSITIQARPKAGLATGTEIRNVAAIVFDPQADGPTINTPATLNTLDRTAPTVTAGPLPSTAALPFDVPIDAADAGSGVARILVTPIRDGKEQTPVELPGGARKYTVNGPTGSYRFRVAVTDGVGRSTETNSSTVELAQPKQDSPDASNPEAPGPSTPGEQGVFPAPPGLPQTTTPGNTTPPGQGTPATPTVAMKLGVANLAALRKKGVPVTLSATGAIRSCTLKITATPKQLKTLKLKPSTSLGKATLNKISTKTVTSVRLSPAFGKRLAKVARVSLSVAATCTSPSGRISAASGAKTYRR